MSIPPLSWLAPCKKAFLICPQGCREGGAWRNEKSWIPSPCLQSAEFHSPNPTPTFCCVCFAPSVCALQALPLDCRLGHWVRSRTKSWVNLPFSEPPSHGACGAASSWVFGAFRSLGWICFWLSLLFALFAESDCFYCLWSQLSLNCLLPVFQICITVVFSWPVFFFFFFK